MADTDGSLNAGLKPCTSPATLAPGARLINVVRAFGPGMLVACLTLIVAVPVAAQTQQPVIAPPPATPEFLSRYDFHLSAAALLVSTPTPAPAVPDQRFSWDTHFGGSFDVVDYLVGRTAVMIDYQAVLGDEFRPFDPNQG